MSVTYNVHQWRKRVNGVSYYYVEGECKSTDTKPTIGIANGSKLTEMDNGGKLTMFDADSQQWLPWGGE